MVQVSHALHKAAFLPIVTPTWLLLCAGSGITITLVETDVEGEHSGTCFPNKCDDKQA